MNVYIEPKIKDLVVFMNNIGYNTYASCQGHGIPTNIVKPYIAFKATEVKAKQLEKILRDDSESSLGKLNWGWSLIANFNGDYEIVYRLAPENPRRKLFKYWRKSLEQDFEAIKKLLDDFIKA
ncbi:hypothetical protein [Pectobacterium brasiliense]|uniref:hypothetical protein n=1 Tax=Pectobacterium brasiliense TaxID=180957 RepID=UPI0015DE50FD|nr:hypothetical protein [Pectobacterium brasiliense]MBA0207966.1 hypothetical protein [Pectobacterium brasiliense]